MGMLKKFVEKRVLIALPVLAALMLIAGTDAKAQGRYYPNQDALLNFKSSYQHDFRRVQNGTKMHALDLLLSPTILESSAYRALSGDEKLVLAEKVFGPMEPLLFDYVFLLNDYLNQKFQGENKHLAIAYARELRDRFSGAHSASAIAIMTWIVENVAPSLYNQVESALIFDLVSLNVYAAAFPDRNPKHTNFDDLQRQFLNQVEADKVQTREFNFVCRREKELSKEECLRKLKQVLEASGHGCDVRNPEFEGDGYLYFSSDNCSQSALPFTLTRELSGEAANSFPRICADGFESFEWGHENSEWRQEYIRPMVACRKIRK
jgi:hypothetical protein